MDLSAYQEIPSANTPVKYLHKPQDGDAVILDATVIEPRPLHLSVQARPDFPERLRALILDVPALGDRYTNVPCDPAALIPGTWHHAAHVQPLDPAPEPEPPEDDTPPVLTRRERNLGITVEDLREEAEAAQESPPPPSEAPAPEEPSSPPSGPPEDPPGEPS